MIVKNEEKLLARCLDSMKDLAEEIVIVDTGSTDKTCEIAARYTKKLFHFSWTGDFSQARNFAFSKCTQEYIYSADADEVIDEENRERFRVLKQALLPEIEIVQMKYGNQLSYSTIYNFDEEYRPKLYKRLRYFVWEYPIHEAVRLDSVIYDSDVVITHMPEQSHTPRDLATFEKMVESGVVLDKRMHNLYAKELFVSGNSNDFSRASAFFKKAAEDQERDGDTMMEACCVAARAAHLNGNLHEMMKYALKAVAAGSCSEICYELGEHYRETEDYPEAEIWYYNAAYETQSILNVHCGDDWPRSALTELEAQRT
jgi:glycosyltransferase involved in cell wall biosynthesis